MSKYSPAPWNIRHDSHDQWYRYRLYSGSELIANLIDSRTSKSVDASANGDLMASAPDLLEVARAFMSHEGKSCFIEGANGWCGECLRCMARVAIAKAEGIKE